MFYAPGLIFDGTKGVLSRRDSFSTIPRVSGTVFMFCAPELIFGGTEGVGSRFHVLRSRTRFQRFRAHRVPFSCFALPYSFSTVPRASGPVFMFCAPGLVFGGAECVGSRFKILRAQTHFRRYRGSRFSFSCFALSDSFSAVLRVSGPVFMFCAPALVFDGTEGVRSRYHVLCSLIRCRRCRVRRVPFSCFECPDSFSAVPRALGPVSIFCALVLVFSGAECVGSVFMFCAPRVYFRRYRGRRFSFTCFVLSDSFLAVLRASGPVFMFCAPALILRSRTITHFRR
jgi:hypothetical protein